VSSADTILLAIHAAIFFVGLPLLVRLLARLVSAGGAGLPLDGAWPCVTWGRALGGYQFVVVCFVLHVGLAFGLSFAASRWLVPPAGPQAHPGSTMVWETLLMAAQWVITCGLILGYIFIREGGRPEALGLVLRSWPRAAWTGLKTLLATMPAVIALLISVHYLYMSFARHEPAMHPVLATLKEQPLEHWQMAALLVMAGLVMPLFEELFWRGIVLTTMLRSGRAELAIVVSAVLFAVSHSSQEGAFVSMPALLALGLGLGYVFYRTRSLAACAAMHAAFNAYNLALVLLTPVLQKVV